MLIAECCSLVTVVITWATLSTSPYVGIGQATTFTLSDEVLCELRHFETFGYILAAWLGH